jgi:Tol biopolymer transport system component
LSTIATSGCSCSTSRSSASPFAAVPMTSTPASSRSRVSGQPSFLPNGTRILFEFYDGASNDAIFASRLDGSGLSRVTEGFPNGDTDPNSSPSGDRISFVRYENGVEYQQALVVSDLDGSHLVQLTPYSFDVGIKQDWAPNGRRLVFTRDANPFPNTPAPDANVATIRSDGSGLRMLTHFSHGRFNALAGSYSPDGRWIVFRLEDNVTGMSGLWRMHTDGTHRRLIFSIPDFKPRYIDWGSRVTSDD